MNHQGSSFLSGCAVRADLLFFAKELDELFERGTPNSSFFVMKNADWLKYDDAVGWPAISMATAKPSGTTRAVVAVGMNGEYWELDYEALKVATGRIDNAPYPVRAVSAIGDNIYLCGMGRLVLRRQGIGLWTDIGPDAPLPLDEAIGFEDIAGFSEHEIYAAGWQGEIWWRDQGQWRQVDSPVSANFNAVTCAPDGNVYIVGDNGAMLRGRREQWEVLDIGRGENLMDVASFGSQVYVVTDFRILRLEDDVLVNDANFVGDDRPATCLYLHRGEDALFSMGPKDLFRMTPAGWERLV